MQITTNERNEAFNPLFAKMQERFCVGGTIAEKMAAEAGLSKKRSKKTASVVRDTAHKSASRKAHSFPKGLFNLKNLGALAMGVLLTSVLFLSGASFSGIREGMTESKPIAGAASEQVTATDSELSTDVLYFATESTPVNI